jgi:hypothetical protein
MSTIGYESWAVDLANVGAVYPFQGTEFLMFIIGMVFWIGWHVIQHRRETAELNEVAKNSSAAEVKASIERY